MLYGGGGTATRTYTFNKFAMQAAVEGINVFILSCILTKTFSLLTEADNTL